MFRQLIATVFAALALNAFAAVEVNQASQPELETVKGIGPGLSTKILEARKAGAFKNWDDFVDRVGGVGPGNAGKFSQAGLTVAGAAYAGAPKAEKAEKADKAEKKTAKAPKAESAR
jgi:competence protein ComEA